MLTTPPAPRPPASVFTITAQKGASRAPSPASRRARSCLFGTSGIVGLVAAVRPDEALTLGYTAPDTNPLQDAAGNCMAAFSGRMAANAGTTFHAAPRFSAQTASFAIAEDHADAATVGTVPAADADGDTLSYPRSHALCRVVSEPGLPGRADPSVGGRRAAAVRSAFRPICPPEENRGQGRPTSDIRFAVHTHPSAEHRGKAA